MIAISGAASRIARSTADWSVTADEGHPSQLPSSCSSTAPTSASTSRSCDVATVLGEERPHARERALDPRREVVGVEAVDDEQAADQLVVDQLVDDRGRGLADHVDDTCQARAVELGHQPQQLLGTIVETRVGDGSQLVEPALDQVSDRPEVRVVWPCSSR